MNKKKFEFIMRQSEEFTKFMARKLGVNIQNEKPKEVLVNG